MVIAAGPSGGGKSSLLNVFKVAGAEAFNVDDCAARLNAARLGSLVPVYQGVPSAIREEARESMRSFIEDHIAARRSFAFETTLRDVTFDQALRAAGMGFQVEMLFIAGGDVEEHIARVTSRGLRGGHTASRESLIEIYTRAMRHLLDAFRTARAGSISRLSVLHNPRSTTPQSERIAVISGGRPVFVAPQAPDWFHAATHGTPYELELLRRAMRAAPSP